MGVATERLSARKEKRGRVGTAWGSLRQEFNDPEKRTAYWMILPTVLIVLLIAAWPILYAFYLSFQRILPNVTEWVWFNNYAVMFSDGGLLPSAIQHRSIHHRQRVLRVHPRARHRDGAQ